MCVAPLDESKDNYNFISALYNDGLLSLESFMVQTSHTTYSKYSGVLMAGFDPTQDHDFYKSNDYTIFNIDVSANLGKDPEAADTKLALLKVNSEKPIKNVKLQDFDDYSNAATTV